jgi:tetratricopeptide (TPR) repeat protein
MRSTFLKWLLGSALVATALVGCADNKSDIAKGRKFAQMGNYAEAHKAFDVALAAKSDDYNALWGKADTFRREGNLAEQATLLEQVMANEDLKKSYAGVVIPALEENYRKQAERSSGDEAKAEAFLRKAIAIKRKSDANVTLAKLLDKRAKAQLAKKDYKATLATIDSALKLRMPKKLRRRMKAQIGVVQFLAFKKDFEPRWATIEPKLTEAKLYDAKTDTIFAEVEVEVDGKPKDENYEANAQKKALIAVTVALSDLSWMVAGKPRPEGASVSYEAALVSVVEKGFTKQKKPKTYKFRISMPRDAVIEKAGEIDRGEFKKAAPPAAPGSAPASGAASGAAPASGAAAPGSAPTSAK